MAGICSVKRSMVRMMRPGRPSGMVSAMLRKTGSSSGHRCASVYAMDFFRLSKSTRPSSMAAISELMLSSISKMSPAALDTDDPEMAMATPQSARLSAGESLVPSPVTATTLPSRW